ncbi:MAG: hypothetical protein N2690_01870 [Rhodocyclaceae bacterium]|nr:hypothetical protein [Rhodocyclaceae bacterium]
MKQPATPWPLLAGAILTTAAGFAGGYALKGRLAAGDIARSEAAVAECQRQSAQERAAAAEAAAHRLAAAQEAEARAVHALHATRARLAAADQRLKESLYALPTARSCGLSAAARGLLNDRIAASDALPQGAALADRAAAQPAADPGEPSTAEADLGVWIAEAIGRYDECRARIDAIRQWDEATHGGR